MSETQVVQFKPNDGLVAQFMPVFTPTLPLQRHQVVKDLIDQILKPDHDFGVIPGTGDKATLLKPGAEKLCTFFGLVPTYEHESVIEHWGQDGSEPLFAYRIKCKLWRGDCMAGEGLGYASSRESKHRYRWVDEDTARRMGLDVSKLPSHDGRKRMFEFDFAIEKAEITGQYGKPESYWSEFRNAIAQGRAKRVQRETKSGTRNGWEIDIGQLQYRIPNPDIADVINTVLKMAMKRALIAAVIVTVNVSDRFTQDLEDFIDVDYVDATPVNCNAAQAQGSAAPAQPIVTAPVNGTSSKFEAQEQKPWSTRGEMAAKFCEMRQRYSALNFSGVYESTLRQFGVASAEKFTDATKALDCYRALVAGLEGR